MPPSEHPSKSDGNGETMEDERTRQLRAAAEGRYKQNDAGRYVIEGEPRPDRKTREKLIRQGFLTWKFSDKTWSTVGLAITSEGEAALRVLVATNA